MDRTNDANPKALQAAFSFLDATLAPLFVASGVDRERRIRTGGSVGLLPVLATIVGGVPLGASDVALSHPAIRGGALDLESRGFDLVVVDECFGSDGAEVLTAVRRADPTSSPVVLRFNSTDSATALDPEVLVRELERAQCALIYSHVRTAITQANWAGVVLGPSSALSVERIVTLDLHAMKEIVLIGCASGRANLFVGEVTVAHAAALAGSREVFSALWPIRPKLGARVAAHLAEVLARGESLGDGLSQLFLADRVSAAPFVLLSP